MPPLFMILRYQRITLQATFQRTIGSVLKHKHHIPSMDNIDKYISQMDLLLIKSLDIPICLTSSQGLLQDPLPDQNFVQPSTFLVGTFGLIVKFQSIVLLAFILSNLFCQHHIFYSLLWLLGANTWVSPPQKNFQITLPIPEAPGSPNAAYRHRLATTVLD